MRRNIVTAICASILCCAAVPLHSADIQVNPPGPVFSGLTGLTWGGTVGSINNNFFFTPLSQSEWVCAYVFNNNPANAHSISVTIQITSDPFSVGPSSSTWQSIAILKTVFTAASPSTAGGFGVYVAGASQVSLNFSNGTTQAGSPDTANIRIIQSQNGCTPASNFRNYYPQATPQISYIQAASDDFEQAYATQASTTNPASGAELLAVSNNSNVRVNYYDRVFITASAASSVLINTTSTLGATCGTTPTIVNQNVNSTNTSQSTVSTACTTVPVVIGTAMTISIPAGQTVFVDLRGFIANASPLGIDVVQSGALTGTEIVGVVWYEGK